MLPVIIFKSPTCKKCAKKDVDERMIAPVRVDYNIVHVTRMYHTVDIYNYSFAFRKIDIKVFNTLV